MDPFNQNKTMSMSFRMGSLPDVERPKDHIPQPAKPDQRSYNQKVQDNFNSEWQKMSAATNPRDTPQISHERMNAGGGPGLQTQPAITPRGISHGQMNMGGGPGMESPGAHIVRDAMDHEISALFSKKPTPGYPMPGHPTQEYNGAFAKGGMFGPGGMLAPGTPGGAAFSGRPSIGSFVQQSAPGSDIFGDTAALIEQRNAAQANLDKYFAKNPLGNDLMANFNSLVSQKGNMNTVKSINDRLTKRDEILGSLQGIMMQGQNSMGTQALQNQGSMQTQALQNQGSIQNQMLQNQGNLAVQGLRGTQDLANLMFGANNSFKLADLQAGHALALQGAQDKAAGARADASNANSLEVAKIGAKPYDYPGNQIKAAEVIQRFLADQNNGLDEEGRKSMQTMLMQFMKGGTGIDNDIVNPRQ